MQKKKSFHRELLVRLWPLLDWLMKEVSFSFFKTKRTDIVFMILFPIISMIIFGYAVAEFFFLITVVLVLHEIGHLLMMHYFNYTNLTMSFYGMLALAQGEKDKCYKKEELMVYLAGAIPGIVIGFIFLAVFSLFEFEYFKKIGYYFIVINGFNLLPVYPLDGGRFIEILFCRKPVSKLLFYSFSLAMIVGYQFVFIEPLIILIGLFVAYATWDTYTTWQHQKRHLRKQYESGFYGLLTNKEKLILISVWSVSLLIAISYYLLHMF